MKRVLIVTSLAGLLVGCGGTPKSHYVGVFEHPHTTAWHGYSRQACHESMDGTYEGNGLCVVSGGTDSVTITPAKAGYRLQVFTVTSNGHTCQFDAKAKAVGEGTLVARAKAQAFSSAANRNVPVVCEVTAKMSDVDTVSVSTNGKCGFFCGMNARLDISAAKRKAGNGR